MRHAQRCGHIAEQRMGAGHIAVEHAGQFGGEALPGDAVGVEHDGMGGETGPDRRDGIVTRPIDEVADRIPVRLVFQIGGDRFGAGNDQAIERRAPEFGQIAVTAGEVRPHGLAARNRWDGEELEPDDDIARSGAQELLELPLGRLAGGVRHVVDQPDREAIAPAQIARRIGSHGIKKKGHGVRASSAIRRQSGVALGRRQAPDRGRR